MNEEELKNGLLKLGWRWVYVSGHGDTEPISEGEFVVGDIEKSMVLAPPDCIWDEPETLAKYWGWPEPNPN